MPRARQQDSTTGFAPEASGTGGALCRSAGGGGGGRGGAAAGLGARNRWPGGSVDGGLGP
eukprot:3453896-Lingulodinium_polyedra.AAC.1